MDGVNYLRQKAKTLFQLSESSSDLSVAERLRLMAAEFDSRADDIQDGADMPAYLATANARDDGDMGRH